jgi:hypothetical protein
MLMSVAIVGAIAGAISIVIAELSVIAIALLFLSVTF